MYLKARVVEILTEAVRALQAEGLLPADTAVAPELERPAALENGDFSTNLALKLAKPARKAPRVIAEALQKKLAARTEVFARVEAAGPGFVNLYLHPAGFFNEADAVRSADAAYGRSDWGAGRRLLLEFVSANPTGPLNIVSARAAAVGDSLARLLRSQGVEVATEYYVNDAGNQAHLLGASLAARFLQARGESAAVPEEGYQGEYVGELAQAIAAAHPDELAAVLAAPDRGAALADWFRRRGVEKIVDWHRTSLREFGVEFTTWFHEQNVVTPPAGSGIRPRDAVTAELQAKGYLFEKDGAVWFRSTDFGDDKDRVLVKSDRSVTYLANDIAYHAHKFDRGFAELVDIWGPDHHGYIARMEAAMQALGRPAGAFRVLIAQQVNLLEAGQPVAMSKRAGKFVTMDDLIADVGRDVARFFFLMRSTDAHLDFDLDVARKHNDDNPVYYVQYAHARICSIMKKAQAEGCVLPEPGRSAAAPDAFAPEELAVARELAAFPEFVEACARNLEPHGLTFYLRDLATAFHRFYTVCRVVDAADPARTGFRLALIQAIRVVLRNGLELLGIGAPETM